MTEIEAVRGDITTLEVDAIVNAANSSLMGGGGVDGAIHRAGGPAILDECKAIVDQQGECATGDAVVTTGGDLPAKHVIHTVGPVWSNRADPDELDALLASCYRQSLDLAASGDVASIAFPNISTGVYHFPKQRAADVAVGAVRAWLDEHPDALGRIVFCCFDDENLSLYRRRLQGSG